MPFRVKHVYGVREAGHQLQGFPLQAALEQASDELEQMRRVVPKLAEKLLQLAVPALALVPEQAETQGPASVPGPLLSLPAWHTGNSDA